ncbi:hypothetical protein TNCV_3566171 [Trichonephila clavipes]|nr:hypothetical protein TNCV_3566171 [Trichonephila clavipes]
MTVPSIKIAITNSEGYEEEFVKNLYETIIANGKRLEELERAEKMRLEELERAEKMRLEELVKEQALKEKELQLKFDLERFKIESGFRDFDPKQSDISLYLVIFERQAKRASIEKKEWVGQLLDNWANLKSATQIAELFDNYEDVRKVNSKPMDRGRNFNTCIPGICSGISAAKGYARKFNQCSKNSEEIKPLYEQAASQVQVTNQVYSLEKELLVKNREDKLGNVVKSILLALRTVSHEYRVYTVRVGVWEKFANPRDVSNGTLDGTGRRG